MSSVLLVYSGGLDSTVLLHYLLKDKKYDVQAVSFRYGQKHEREVLIAQKNCERLNIAHGIIDLPLDTILQSTLLKTGAQIPEGHYEEASMKQTVVPMRNLIFSSIAAGYAASRKIENIALAVHAGDHTIYPDCRPEFFATLKKTILLADWNEVGVLTPFLNYKKDQIVKTGLELGVDFASTWTCYKGGESPCGKCGSCTERSEAFARNGAEDPLRKL